MDGAQMGAGIRHVESLPDLTRLTAGRVPDRGGGSYMDQLGLA